MIRKFVSAAVLCLALSGAALAQSLSAEDRAALQARVDSFSTAFGSGDMAAVSEVLPPKMLDTMARAGGVDVETLKSAMITAMETAMESVEVNRYGMDTAAASISETSTGRTYLLIPTEMEMRVNTGARVAASTQTLAFEDGGTWYLVNVDTDSQVNDLTAAYPEFLGITFPKATFEVIEE